MSTSLGSVQFLAVRFREGGKVQRCHTIPHHSAYSNAQHSWDAVTLLLLLNPNCSLRLVKALLWHDVHERLAGDLPRHAALRHPELGAAYKAACESEDSELGLRTCLEGLDQDDRCWLKAIDAIEFYLWCQDEIAAGNRHVEDVNERIVDIMATMSMPPACRKFVEEFKWTRTRA